MTEGRDRWKSRYRFILAAVGCSVGLGNVWRFPYVAYTSGGGAFMIPYLIALLTAGIPLLMLEFGIGQKSQKAGPGAMRSMNKSMEWVGWWGVGVSFVIVSYYAVIMGWAWDYLIFSFRQSWLPDAGQFYREHFLAVTEGPADWGKLNIPVLGGLVATWMVIYWILHKGIERVGKVVMWSVPLPVILLVILVIRGVTLPGAIDGISYYLTPDFSKLLDPKVWLAAYGQVFFSVGIGWGIMVAYASYRPQSADVTNSAFITALLDGGFSYFAGFAVFSTVGYLATMQGVGVPEAVTSGFGLAFIAYPTAISAMPFLSEAIGVIFFLMLLTLGIDSAFAMVEAVVAATHDRWNISKKRATKIICLIGFVFGVPFCFAGGYHWMDIVDHWISAWGLAIVGLLECIVAGWMFPIETLREFLNKVSDFRVGIWWTICIKWVTPIILIIMIIQNLIGEFTSAYGGYPVWSLMVGGWLVTFLVIGISVWLQLKTPSKVTIQKEKLS
ncbi:MAG: sodium-dependent transporter [Candidatus Electryonea clarkiae]|nr:sodium-dependent transporter [Candidatus Electryonea clarkiae]MDP8288556.1 sodium-dependent transporter [Candidatus Electryonea clarkiae]